MVSNGQLVMVEGAYYTTAVRVMIMSRADGGGHNKEAFTIRMY